MASKKVAHTAPDQYLGYGLQATHLTARLFDAEPGSFWALEVFDDVAEQASGNVKLVQTKSARGNNPVANRALAMWKTFGIWASQLGDGGLDLSKTCFELYVSRNVSGDIVDAFSSASTSVEAASALLTAKTILFGSGVEPLPASLAPHVKTFFDTPHQKLEELVRNFTLVCATDSPHKDLEKIIEPHPVSASKRGVVLDHMCGWVKRRVEELMETNQPAIVARDDFHTVYTAFCRLVDRSQILPSIKYNLTRDEIENTSKQAKPFIKQMLLIDLAEDQILAGTADYLLASASRAAWSASGDVDEESFTELEKALQRAWTNQSAMSKLEFADRKANDLGRLIYFKCMSHRLPLQAMEAPEYFVPGCYQQMADNLTLGWHPSYTTMLAG
ncbi:MAG TPA: ABC-three component system protein [Fimbriimonadaceae bacterium]|jgi:hypothetical protein